LCDVVVLAVKVVLQAIAQLYLQQQHRYGSRESRGMAGLRS
jgi:hypothetical protein